VAKKLTALAVANRKPRAARYEVPDGSSGLRCVIQPSGARGWCVRFRRPDKRPAKLTLDNTLSLAAARAAAAAALHDVATGKDPAALKRSAKATAAAAAAELAADTVKLHAQQFLERYARKRTRPNSWKQTEHILEDVVLPAWGGRTIHDIKRRDVIALVEHVAEGRPILANRTLAVLSKFFGWMMARDVIVASPVAGVARPVKETARDRSLSDIEIKALWLACDTVGGPMAACIRVMMLTGQRRSEVAGMRWDELTGDLWSLPPSRVKNNRPHSVPLSRQVLAVLEAVPRIGDHVFTLNGVRPLTNFSGFKQEIDAVMTPSQPFVWHDLRRSVAAGMQRLGVRTETIEQVLNHRSGSYRGIVGTYQVDPMHEARRDALQRWADHVEAVVRGEPTGKVVRLRG
jgi:integrase